MTVRVHRSCRRLAVAALLALAAPLASAALAAPAAPAATRARTVAVHVYFLLGDHGAVAHRTGPALAPARTAVVGLLAGPTATERAQGLASAVPDGTRLLHLTVHDGLATVDLSKRFASGGGSASMLGRLGQLVYTLTAVPHVRTVELRLDGRRVHVFGGEGVILRQPLTRASFPDLVP